MRIPRKIVAIARGATAALVVAVGGTIVAPGQPLLLVAIGAVGGTAVAVGARRVVHRDPRYAGVAVHHRDAIARWISASSAAHVAWIALYVTRPDLGIQWVAALLGLSGLSYVVARGQEYLMAHPVPGKADEKAAAALAAKGKGEDTSPVDKAVRQLQAALDRTEYAYLDVLTQEQIKDGRRFVVRVPARYSTTIADDTDKKKKGRPALTTSSAESIAIGLSEVLGAPMRTDWVRISSRPEAGHHEVTVMTRDVMADVIPYVDDDAPVSIHDSLTVGWQIDGTPVKLKLAAHGQVVGKTRSGKTSMVNTLIARALRADDCAVWVGGVEKLYDLLAGWLLPYEAHPDEQIPIDYIASGQRDVMDMLVAALEVARYRQRVPISQRSAWPHVVIVLDEASFGLENTTEKVTYRGTTYTLSGLVGRFFKLVGSAGLWMIVINQRSTQDQLGDSGGIIRSNFGWSSVFKVKDHNDVGRVLNVYGLPQVQHKGEFYIDNDSDGILRAKSAYIQEVDPSKPHLHDGLTLADISWARRGMHTDLDPGSARAAGDAYARRHRTASPALIGYLTGADELDEEAPVAEVALSGEDAGRAEARAEMIRLGLLPAPAGEAPAVPVSVPAPAAPETRRDRVLSIVRDADGPIETAEIIAALTDRGDVITNPTVVTNLLSKLVKSGDLARPETGSYTLGRLRIAS